MIATLSSGLSSYRMYWYWAAVFEVLHLFLKTGSRFSINLALIPSFRSSV
jgi:hypothetical protein